MATRLIALFVFVLCTVGAEARTLVGTSWQQMNHCIDDGFDLTDDGQDAEVIRLERRYDDGTTEYKFMSRLCGQDCWEEGPWLPGSYSSAGNLPVQANPDGSWYLLNPVYYTGSFTSGDGPTCRGFVSDPYSTKIYVPAVIIAGP